MNRTGNTDRDIQLRRNDLTGLTDLHVVGYETGVDRSAGSTHCRTELVGQRVQVPEVVAVLHAATAGNDDLRCCQLRTIGFGQFFTHKTGLARIVSSRNRFNSGRATLCSHRIEAGGSYGDDLDRSRRLHGGDGVTGVDRTGEGVGGNHRNDLGDLIDIQLSSDARQDVLAIGRCRSQNMAMARSQLYNQGSDVFRQLVRVGFVVGHQHFRHTGNFGGGVGNGAHAGTGHQQMNVTADLLGSSKGVERSRGYGRVVVFSDNQDRHLDYLRFVFQFLDQFSHRLDLDAGAACSRRFDLEGLVGRGRGNAQCIRGQHFKRLFLGLHDIGQRSVAWLVQTQVRGHDGWQAQGNGLQAAVDFTGHGNLVTGHFNPGCERTLRVAAQRSQHLAGLVVITVDGLFAKDHQLRLLLVDHGLEQLSHGQRSQLLGGLDQHGTVGTQCQGGTQLFLSGGRADGDDDDFGGYTLLFKTNRLFNGDFAERVHGHFDVGKIDAGVVRLDANLDVVVDHSFDSYKNLHGFLTLR
ncbi:hypothetical protein ALP49_05314 [Pseudomonas syringae pv. solidagae]|nr:hypothetical protein ALP49_05314 [Pseudomonas syringae pv. solidagae]